MSAGSSQPADTRIEAIQLALRQAYGPHLDAANAALAAIAAELAELRQSVKTLVKEDGIVVSRQAAELAELREALEAARAFVAGVDISFGLMAEPADQWRYALLPKIDSALSRGATP